MKKQRVLIVDGLNAYLRAYIVDPSLSVNGQPIGGLKGFVKILQKLVRTTKPDQIIVAWDGPNGSRKRRTLDKNYKEGRKPVRLNRSIRNLSENEELQNKMWQHARIVEYLNSMPVIQFMAPEVEADDVIAYLTQLPYYRGWEKVIVSNDRDFMQLCDNETILWRPTKDEFLNADRVVEQVGIHPNNMALARAIVGDKSDNLEGVRGVGFGVLKKRFPYLAEAKDYTLGDVVKTCETTESKLKVFAGIIESQDTIRHNYKMMQLYAPMLSVQTKQHIEYTVENFECELNRTEIFKMMTIDGFGELNWSDLEAALRGIVSNSKRKQTP